MTTPPKSPLAARRDDIVWHGFTRHEVLKFARKDCANWVANISREQFDDFISWARKTGVYSPDTDKTWDAFRGYCIGLRNKSETTLTELAKAPKEMPSSVSVDALSMEIWDQTCEQFAKLKSEPSKTDTTKNPDNFDTSKQYIEKDGDLRYVGAPKVAREYFIEIFVQSASEDMIEANTYHRKPKHWPKKPHALQVHVVEREALTQAQEEIADLKQKSKHLFTECLHLIENQDTAQAKYLWFEIQKYLYDRE